MASDSNESPLKFATGWGRASSSVPAEAEPAARLQLRQALQFGSS